MSGVRVGGRFTRSPLPPRIFSSSSEGKEKPLEAVLFDTGREKRALTATRKWYAYPIAARAEVHEAPPSVVSDTARVSSYDVGTHNTWETAPLDEASSLPR
jgi:hypothetical protein